MRHCYPIVALSFNLPRGGHKGTSLDYPFLGSLGGERMEQVRNY